MSEDVNVGDVRRWAKEQGLDVPARGAISKEIVEMYKHRDQTPLEPPLALDDASAADDEKSTSDDAPAGHVDAAGIEDEVTATITTDDKPDKSTSDDRDDDGDEETTRYRLAWLIPDEVSDEDVARGRNARNRVSIQTLENGFIHYQRNAGTDEVQARLTARGFYHGTASGYANEDTVMAYARFQDSIGLPGTGIPERVSLEALGFDVIE